MALKIKRQRKPDFSASELNYIVNLFVEHNELLTSRHSNDVTNKKKKEIFDTIVASVNAVGGNSRTFDSIKEKWQNMKSSVKKKASEFHRKQRQSKKRTGGGEGEVDAMETVESILDSAELKVYRILPVESYAGFTGGIQTGELESPNDESDVADEEEDTEEDIDIENVVPLATATATAPAAAQKRPRWKPPAQRMSSEDYYKQMVDVEKKKLSLQEDLVRVQIEYFKTKTQYYNSLLIQNQPSAAVQPASIYTTLRECNDPQRVQLPSKPSTSMDQQLLYQYGGLY